jgi:hypothetical protein
MFAKIATWQSHENVITYLRKNNSKECSHRVFNQLDFFPRFGGLF